jgi:hypothetical protein
MQNTDLIQEVVNDHEQIKTMMSAVDSAQGPGKALAFKALADKLKHHEAAEQRVVHPLSREAQGGDMVAQERITEEKKAETVLTRLEKLDVESADFAAGFASLKKDVLAHATSEESKEHPRIRKSIAAERLVQLAAEYRKVEAGVA